MPVFLFIWHKFIQPLIDRWYGKPKLESGKTDDKLKSDENSKVRLKIYIGLKIALILTESKAYITVFITFLELTLISDYVVQMIRNHASLQKLYTYQVMDKFNKFHHTWLILAMLW